MPRKLVPLVVETAPWMIAVDEENRFPYSALEISPNAAPDDAAGNEILVLPLIVVAAGSLPATEAVIVGAPEGSPLIEAIAPAAAKMLILVELKELPEVKAVLTM